MTTTASKATDTNAGGAPPAPGGAAPAPVAAAPVAPAAATEAPKTPATDTPTATKGDGAAPATGAEKKEASPTDGKAPESKDFDIKLPEGVEADAATLDEFKAIAKEAGMKGEAAQKAVDLHVKALKAGQAKRDAEWAGQVKTWKEQNRSNEEYGGKSFEANVAAIKAAFDRFDEKGEAKEVLEKTGLGDHPALVGLFHRIAQASKSDSTRGTTGAPVKSAKSTSTNTFTYPSMEKA